MNKDLEQYIEENNYYEDQKKKANIDKYFSVILITFLKNSKTMFYYFCELSL